LSRTWSSPKTASSDGVLVARHENEISETTDVASRPEFAGRKVEKSIDRRPVTGWFAEDFTLAELKTLRVRERIPDVRPANAAYDGRFEVPTLQEVLDLARTRSAEFGRPIGIYPEIKHPTYFRSINMPLEKALASVLSANGYVDASAPVLIQSFEPFSLVRLSGMTRVPLIQLLNTSGRPFDFTDSDDPRTWADLRSAEGLAWIAGYARGVGPNKDLIVPRDDAGRLLTPTSLVADAHAAGLIVHAWTFRDEDRYLPHDFQGDPAAEYRLFFCLGVDGVFADTAATAVAERNAWKMDDCAERSATVARDEIEMAVGVSSTAPLAQLPPTPTRMLPDRQAPQLLR
jgi:glycerophosphoryl diester phosphodiesterase